MWTFRPERGEDAGDLAHLAPVKALPAIGPQGAAAGAGGEVDIWCCRYLEVRQPDLLSRYLALLSPEERARHDRFLVEPARHEYLVTRALARWVLSRYAAVSPESLVFAHNDHGKPRLDRPAAARGLAFNISHAAGMAVCAVASEPMVLGIDIEDVGRGGAELALADRFFAPSEVRALRALPRDRQRARFFAYWTLKESYIKARGLGLAIPLQKFAFSLRPDGPILLTIDPGLNDDPARWRFALMRASERHALALGVAAGPTPPVLRHAFCVPLQGIEPQPPAP
jgi:4'-phosphopantetheinyl transferase